jgi:hypothetical protein
MRNRYDRRYVIIHEPVTHRRGHTFERKLAEAESKGYVLVGHPSFHTNYEGAIVGLVTYGTVLLRRRKGGV